MIKNLSLVICMVILLATFGFAQNGLADAADVRLFTLTGPDVHGGDGVDTITEWTSAGAFVNSVKSSMNHGISIPFGNPAYTIGVTGGNDYENLQFYRVAGLPWNGGTLGSITMNLPNLDAPEGNDTCNVLWCTAHDYVAPYKAFILGRWKPINGVWIGGIQRLTSDGTTSATVQASTGWDINQLDANNVSGYTGACNPYMFARVFGEYIYWSLGYNIPGVIYRLPKNFSTNDIPLKFIYSNDPRYSDKLIAGSKDWKGFCFDEDGYLYVSWGGSQSTPCIAKFAPNGDLIQYDYMWFTAPASRNDLQYGAGKFFITADSGGVDVYRKEIFGSPTFLYNIGGSALGVVRSIALVPSSVSFTGTVNLVSWNGGTSNVEVQVRVGTTFPTVAFVTRTLQSATLVGGTLTGTFTVDIPASGAQVQVKHIKSLSSSQVGTTGTFNLLCGDNNNDNKIDDLDFLRVINNFGSLINGAVGDGNGDGKTDDLDFLLVITNFGGNGS
ncbi:MAG: dockerin type I domain-containing protein [bacterium]